VEEEGHKEQHIEAVCGVAGRHPRSSEVEIELKSHYVGAESMLA
jgi:hypothetical protein